MRTHQEEKKNVPRGACFDKFHNVYVPYGSHFYRRTNDPKLILYTRGSQRRVKIRERRNNQWDVELTLNTERLLLKKVTISHSGLDKEGLRLIKDSIKKFTRKIPVYKYYNTYSFTQVIPPIKRKKVRLISFRELLLFPDKLKIQGGSIDFRKQLKQEIVKGMKHGFQYTPLMQGNYGQRVVEEDEGDSQVTTVRIEHIKENRINFRGFVPLFEVIRAIRSIYEGNFKTAKDQKEFTRLVKNIILTSSEFIVSQNEFQLGYASIHFAQCFIPIKRYFPYWKQIVCKYTPQSSPIRKPTEYEIEDETYSDWISESSYGQTLYIDCEIIGMENYCKVSIDAIRLKLNDEEVEERENEEVSEEKENTHAKKQEPVMDPKLVVPVDPLKNFQTSYF